jgi:hypothetical protein
MKTAAFKQQDYKFHVARKLEQFNNFPKMDGYQNTEKLKTSQQVFSDNKKKVYIYLYVYILKTAASKREFLLLFFLRRFLTGQYNKFNNLFPTASLNLDPSLTIHTIPLAGTTGSM